MRRNSIRNSRANSVRMMKLNIDVVVYDDIVVPRSTSFLGIGIDEEGLAPAVIRFERGLSSS